MKLQTLLNGLMLGVFYPLWLFAGAVDYLCHRRTDIAHTSGVRESWFHVAQFLSLGAPLVLGTLLDITTAVFTLLTLFIAIHSALSYVDVAYTDGRRYISPVEQHAHALLGVLPVILLALLAVLHWDAITAGSWAIRVKSTPMPTIHAALLIGSYFVLAGVPIVEELARTSRASRE